MFLVAPVLLIASSNILVSSAMQEGPGKEDTDFPLIVRWEESISANSHFEIQPSSFIAGSYDCSRHATMGGRADGSIQRHMMGQSMKVPKRKCVVDDLLTISLPSNSSLLSCLWVLIWPILCGHGRTPEIHTRIKINPAFDSRHWQDKAVWYMPLVWAPAFKCDMWLLTGRQVAHRLV